jgi:hypothetical protein
VKARAKLLSCFLLAAAVAAGSWDEPARADRGSRKSSRHESITEGLDCSSCHTSAGWKVLDDDGASADATGFDHARTGFPLTGRHAHVACTGCHHEGEQVTRACSGCHDDPHERRLGGQCDECHDARSFRSVSAMQVHSRTRLPLTGMHALADCTECHRSTGPKQWSSAPVECFACHADDFRRSDVHPLHTGGSGMPPSPAFSHECSSCHRAISWTPAFIAAGMFDDGVMASASGLRIDPRRHELLFPIAHGAHRGATCEDCHGNEPVSQAVRCTGCHAHNPLRLRREHAKLPAALKDGACLHCHAGGVSP